MIMVLCFLVPYPCSSVFVFYWVLHIFHIFHSFFMCLWRSHSLIAIFFVRCLHSKTNLLEISFMILLSTCLFAYICALSTHRRGQGVSERENIVCNHIVCRGKRHFVISHISSNCISCFKVHFMCALPLLSEYICMHILSHPAISHSLFLLFPYFGHFLLFLKKIIFTIPHSHSLVLLQPYAGMFGRLFNKCYANAKM